MSPVSQLHVNNLRLQPGHTKKSNLPYRREGSHRGRTVLLPNAFIECRKEQKERERTADTIELSTGNNNRKNASPCSRAGKARPRLRLAVTRDNVDASESLVRRSNENNRHRLFLFCFAFLSAHPTGEGERSPCGDHRQADGENQEEKQRRNTTIMHLHVGRKKRHAVQPSVRCCLPANGTSPKYSSTLSVDMLLSDRDTLDNEPLDASRLPPAGNCSKSSSVSVSMSRDLRLYTCHTKNETLGIYFVTVIFPHFSFCGSTEHARELFELRSFDGEFNWGVFIGEPVNAKVYVIRGTRKVASSVLLRWDFSVVLSGRRNVRLYTWKCEILKYWRLQWFLGCEDKLNAREEESSCYLSNSIIRSR